MEEASSNESTLVESRFLFAFPIKKYRFSAFVLFDFLLPSFLGLNINGSEVLARVLFSELYDVKI